MKNKFLTTLYSKIFKINDTPQKIALGLGLGVFTGIFPGIGVLASIFLAFIFRANRAAAIIGSLLTNTWLSIIIFLFAIQTGSLITGGSWKSLYDQWMIIINTFSWQKLFKVSILNIVFPVAIGYLVISLALGILTYLIALIITIKLRRRK